MLIDNPPCSVVTALCEDKNDTLAACDNTLTHESPTLFLNSPNHTMEEKLLYVEEYLCGLKLSYTNNHFTHNHHVYGASCNYFERGKHTNSSHDSLIILYMFLSLQSCTNLIVVLSNVVPLLVTIMREEK